MVAGPTVPLMPDSSRAWDRFFVPPMDVDREPPPGFELGGIEPCTVVAEEVEEDGTEGALRHCPLTLERGFRRLCERGMRLSSDGLIGHKGLQGSCQFMTIGPTRYSDPSIRSLDCVLRYPSTRSTSQQH